MVAQISDFEAQLEHRCNEAVGSMGRRSAEITANAAAQGALGNSRLVIVLTDALEAQWRTLVDGVTEDMRKFITATNTKRASLINSARQQMLTTLPILRKASRVEKLENGFPARILAGGSLERVEALIPYMEMRLRQFGLGIGEPSKANWIVAFFRELSWQTLIAASATVLLAAIVAIWAVLRTPGSLGDEATMGNGHQDVDANLTLEPIQEGSGDSQLGSMQSGNSTKLNAESAATAHVTTPSEPTNQSESREDSIDTEPATPPAIAPRLPSVDLLGRLCQTNTIAVSFEMRSRDLYYEVLNGSQVLRVRCNGQSNFTVIKDGYETDGTVGRNAIDFMFRVGDRDAIITCNVSAASITSFSFVGRISCRGMMISFESRPARIDI